MPEGSENTLASPQVLVHETNEQRISREDVLRREVMFEIDKVTVSYGDVPAVREIDFDVHHRSITALIGPSGCG
ncbi:MAG: hypothetical protein M3N04_03085, partial [Actinomycetota bacterium]|nr:hypothetical protein [Actinomycetota bacterium]